MGKKGKRMATQIAETPVLYGKDAEAVLKQIQSKPSERQLELLKKQYEQKFANIQTRRR
ncbi:MULTISPECIES: hypothetical protein [unclassified Paenibacillus]|uniref:hypothetical protein n=1 Tax=unclassified Paenibacillus TaxID=185978 RepID=UPI00020D7003|nr:MULTISPECIES: hypothetical protein [unclassified Paenibacillus]EGL20103.1 hypothetical protein HMPREF9413_1077 [Paenibacillus sp. HGF7]EPD82028.1 hypothetical protein HMPREF1207_03854 [Paenibacillus sp. HGH0039]